MSKNIIVDTFIFYNELDMLKYRLETLNQYVDYFIIVEATKTHVGSEKPLYFSEHEYLFAPYLHKIIHIVEKDLQSKDKESLKKQQTEKNTDYTTYCWNNERKHRNGIDKGIQKLEKKLSSDTLENTLILISDCDEIPNPEILKTIKDNNVKIDISCLEQDFYYYNIRNRMREKWYHAKIISYSHYINEYERNPSKIRLTFNVGFIPNGGWHLSYFGDPLFIKNKLNQFAHQEFNTPELANTQIIQRKIKMHQSVVRDEKLDYILERDNPNLPPNVLVHFPIPKENIAD